MSCVIENMQNQNRSSFNTTSLHAAFVCISQNNKKVECFNGTSHDSVYDDAELMYI